MSRKAVPMDIMGDVLNNSSGAPVEVPLALIDDNPFQERSEYGDLADLAGDIREHGLLQPPIVRPMPDGRYQLAFGHRRKRACELAGLATITVMVRSLDDDRMATIAYSENDKRADVSAIDRARSIQRMIERFGWTHQQVADKLSISRPTVSNLLRLLRAPEEVQQALASGKLSDRQASALLPLYDLPESIRSAGENQWQIGFKPTRILNAALEGASSDNIREKITTLVKLTTIEVQTKPWYDEFFELDGTICGTTCDRCPSAVKRDNAVHCPNQDCRNAKDLLHYQRLVAPACEASGLPAGMPAVTAYGQEDFRYANQAFVEEIFAEDPLCPNLCVIWAPDKGWKTDARRVDGHPDTMIVCQPPNSCSCLAKRKAALTRSGDDKAARTSQRIGDTLMADATPHLHELLSSLSDPILRILVPQFDGVWHYGDRSGQGDITTVGHDQLVTILTKELIRRRYYEMRSPAANRTAIEQMLAVGEIESPWQPQPPAQQPVGELIAKHIADIVTPKQPTNGYIEPTVDREAPDYIDAKLQRIDGWIDDYQDPGDGLPTPESVAGNFANLEKLFERITGQESEADQLKLKLLYDEVYNRLAALSDRVQQSYSTYPE